MNQLFKYLGKKNKMEYIKAKRTLDDQYNHKKGIIERINDKYYIDTNNDTYLRLCYYHHIDNSLYYFLNGDYEFKEKIYSISISSIENKILICLLNNKIVKIFDYDIKRQNILYMDDKEIKDNLKNGIKHFYKCIQITKNSYITSDSDFIKLWSSNSKHFYEIKAIEINTKTFDLLLINNEYLISSQPKDETITFYDTKNLYQIKKLLNIDCIDSTKCFFKYNDKYILVSCYKGIGLLFIKTKELTQYIRYWDINYKKICCDDVNNIYILTIKKDYESFLEDYIIKIRVANIIEDEFKLIKEYDEIQTQERELNLTCLSNNIILLWKDNIYSSKEKNIN